MPAITLVSLSRAPGEDGRKVLAIGRDLGGHGALEALAVAARSELIEAATGNEGLRAFYAARPDVVVLDLELADADGFDVLATIRELSDVPLIALSGDDGEDERVRILRAGADDCVTKPAGEIELQARIEALLRRPGRSVERPPVLIDDFVRIDRARHRVEVLGTGVELTPIEFRMLTTFAENPGRVLEHGQLLELVWGDRIRERDEVKLYVSYLRRKLAAAAAVDPVETVRGVGYRYNPRHLASAREGTATPSA